MYYKSNSCTCGRKHSKGLPWWHQCTVTMETPLHCNHGNIRFNCCSRFSCCSPLASDSAAALDCVGFNCSSIASASAAALRLHPIQLLLPTAAPRLRPIQMQLPNCIRFDCCSPPALLEDSSPHPMFSNILCRVRGSVN